MDFEYIKPLLADASGTGDGEYTDAERRADVATQFRDKFGRWIEMGRGIKGKVRLGKGRGTDAGRTARIVGKFINATPDGKFARVLVDPSDPYFGGKIVHIRNNNAEEILATLDPEYLKKRGIQLGKNTEGFEVGDEGIQDEDTLTIEDPTPQDLEDSKADLPDPGDYKQEASTLSQSAVAGKDLAAGNIVYDQGSDQYGKITQVRTLADGTKQIFVQFQNGRRAIMNVAADHQITAWTGEQKQSQEALPTGPSPKEEGSVANLGIELQTATMDAGGARLPTPGAFTGAFQKILNKAKDWADIFKRLWNQTVTYFDFETTGISNYDGDGIKNSPIQLGAVKVKNGKIIGRFNVYMNPGSKLSEWSADNLKRDVIDENGNVVLDENGKPQSTLVTPEWLAEQMSPTEALKLFLEFIGPKALLGGQNVPFDLEILQRMADEAGVKLDIAGTIDSKDLASLLPTYDPEKGIDGPKQIADKETGRMRPSSSLGPVANFLGFEPANWHSADGDAEDSYNLVREIIARAAKENNPDMSLLNFPEMQRLYKERMAAFKNLISQNNPVTQKQLEALNELANSDNSVVAEEAKKAIAEATTRGKAAEVLARLDDTISRPNNNTGPSPKQERGGPGLPDDVLGVLARLRRRIGLKDKKVKKRKNYIPMGFDRMSGWDQYPQEFRDIYDSAADLDQFVQMLWNLRAPGKPIDETMYAIAAAIRRSMDAIDNGRGILTYRGIRIEFDSKDDFDGKLLEELKGYLDTMKKFGFKLPTTIIFGKAGTLTFDKRKLGFNPETGSVTLGEADIDEHGGLRLILWDQLHNLEGDNDMVQFMGTDPKTGQDRYGSLGGERISLLLSTLSHEIGHLFNREKHGRPTPSRAGTPVWAELKKIFWGSDSAPFKRFNVVPGSSDENFDERMGDLFMAAFIAFHNKEERVLPSVAQFWKIAIEPFIDAEPSYWTANAAKFNKPEPKKGKAKPVKDTAKRPKDVIVGDVLYGKDGNLHGKVVRISQDKNGNWHYWIKGKNFKPGDVFPTGLDEYVVHKDGIVYLSEDGVHFVPDVGPDMIDSLPTKLDSKNSSAEKVEDIRPGMVYESPDGPANVVNVIKHGVNSDPRKNRDAKERIIVYIDPKTGEIRHEVVPVGTFKKVLTSSKSNVLPAKPKPGGGRGGGRGGNASEPVSEEPEDDQNDPDLQAIERLLAILEGIGMRIDQGNPDYMRERAEYISRMVASSMALIKELGLKDYARLRLYLEANMNPGENIGYHIKEFLNPGYRRRQGEALDRIKELLRERIVFEDQFGEKADPAEGIIEDILESYKYEDKEELLDLLDKNLKPGEIKHVEKREGISLRGNWDEVVKAVQDIINSNLDKQQPVSEESEESAEPEITTDDPIGRGKIDPKGYGTNEGYVRMTHPTPDFPAETDTKKLIEKGFEIEDQDNQTGPSPKEEEPEEGEEGVLPPEDPSKFAAGKKTTIVWHNKDFSSPGGRIKITYTRKADGSLDRVYKEIQWVHWDGSISGDGYGPSELYDFKLGQDEQETFRRAFEFATEALAERNKEYNNNKLPGQFPHSFKKVGDDHIWRIVKDAKTGKLKAGRDTKRDMEKKPPFGAIISNKDGKWIATVLDAKGNTVATFEVDGDANDQSALENIMNQSYAELAKKYREINSPRPTPAARPATPANSATTKITLIDDSFVKLKDVAADWEKDKYDQIVLGWNMKKPRDGSGNMSGPDKNAEFWGEIRYWGSPDHPRDHITVRFQDKNGYWREADLYGYYKDPELVAKGKQWLAQQYEIWKDPARREATEGTTADGYKPKRGDTIYLVNRGKVEKITLDQGLEDVEPDFANVVEKYFISKTNWGSYDIMLGTSERSAALLGNLPDAYQDENLAKEELQRRIDNEKELKSKYGLKFFNLDEDEEEEQPAGEESKPTGPIGEHNHPLPDDVQMFAVGSEDLYARYVINGEGFQHEADYPDIGLKDGLRFGAEIYYQEEIKPEDSYDKKGRPAGWRIHLLDKNWKEDYARRKMIEGRNSVVPGDINDPEVWKKAVEEARRMVASAIAERGGENVPYTSEYIALESLDQIQSGDYLMYSGFYPPTIRWKGTKSEEISLNFYAQVVSVSKDKDGNRIFEIKEPNLAQGGYYDNVFLNDEEFLDEFGGGITGLARYSDENPNVKPSTEPVAETQVEEEEQLAEELTEEQRQANRDAWTEVGLLYRKYRAARNGKNMKREAKRLRQELGQFPIVMLFEKLNDYRDILDNTRKSSTDPNEKKALTKRSAEISDAMKQLNTRTMSGVKEGNGKPTDPLDFNFDDLFKEIEIEDGISESDVEETIAEVAEEPETTEEPATEEEPVKNVIETAGGVLDFDGLSPMQLGKINKHLDKLVRWEGEVMTYRELYKKFAVGRHKHQSLKDVDFVKGKSENVWGPIKYFLYTNEDGGMVDVPKMIYDAFKPNNSDPKLDSDSTAPVQEAKMAEEKRKYDERSKAKAEAEAKAAEEKTEEPVETKPEEPATTPTVVETPKDLGPVQITKDTAKQYLAEKIDVGWTIYGPDGYALGVVVKKDTLGRVAQFTVRGPNGKETKYNFNFLTKLNAFSPKDKKDIEKAEKAKAKVEKAKEEIKAESEDQQQEETADKISREDGFRLFEAVKKVYDFIHRMQRTDDPDAAKKDANDKVNQLAKILNPEDVDDFIRYVDAANKNLAVIMSNTDYLKNFSDYLDKYTSGQGVAKNPIHRSMDGREIKDGDILNVVDKYGDVRQIRFGIIKKRSNRPLTDKADTYELGYAIEVEEDGSAWIVNINNSREVYEVSRSSHVGPAAAPAPATPAKPEVVEEAKPAAGTEYNKDLDNDLAVFINALEDMVERFRNQPGADKDVYKAATKELYNELKKLNSLYNDSETSGDDLEKIREVYDQKMRDIGDIQAAKTKDLGPSPKEEVFAQSAADLQNAIIQEAVRLGDIEDKYDDTLRDTLFRVANSYTIGEALKQITAKRIFRYMSDVKFDGLLKAITTNTDALDLLHAGQTLDIKYSRMLSPTEWVYDPRPPQKDAVWVYNAFNADLSDIKDGTELLVQPINNSMVDGLTIFTVDNNLIDAVKKAKGDVFSPADSIDSKDILEYMKDKFLLRVFSSYNQDDVDHLKLGMIGYLVKSWAISSNDNNLKMHAMQHLASEIFAMDNKSTAGWSFVENENESYIANMRRAGRAPEGVNTLDELQDYLDQRIVAEANEHKEVYTKFIHAMYNSTQDALKEAGIDGMILYRGTGAAEFKDTDKLPLIFSLFGFGTKDLRDPKFKDFINKPQEGYVYHRPMSSWSTKFEIANTFSSRYGSNTPLIAGVKIPAERIFALPGSGFGCYNEAEVVVLGGELTPATYVIPDSLTLDQKSEFLEAVKNKVGPKTILTTERDNGDFVELLEYSEDSETGPSPKEERPSINLDSSNDNADWIKQVSWDLPTDMTEFLNMFSTRDQLSYFMTEPVAVGMPEEMSRNLWPAADEHFKKLDELPKPEEPKYLPEPFDPQDPNLDLEAFYNFDYSKNPDGSPFTRSQAGEMGYAELAVLREIYNGTEEDIKDAKRHRLDVYLKVTAQPNPKTTTTVESVDDQIEGDFDLDSPVEEYPNPFNASTSVKRYVNYFTDKYGRRYALLTDIFQNNTGNLYVTAYDTTGKTPEQVQEDFIDSKNYLTPNLHIAFIGTGYATPDPNDKNYESKRYIDLVETWPEYRRRGLATALLNVARKYSKEPIVHSTSLSNAGFAFSNSVDRDPQDHTSEKSIAWQKENSTSGPSPKEEAPVGNFLPEPFDPSDPDLDIEKAFNFNPTQLLGEVPSEGYSIKTLSDYHDDKIAEYKKILEKYPENSKEYLDAKKAIKMQREMKVRSYLSEISKPNLDSKTNSSTISERFDGGDFEPSLRVDDYVPSSRGGRIERYQNRYTDKYGRKYLIVTDVNDRLERSFVFAVDINNKSEDEIKKLLVSDVYDNVFDKGENVATLSFDSPEIDYRNGYVDSSSNPETKLPIGSIWTSLPYQRRGLATAILFAARQYIPMYISHSETLSKMGSAFSISVDPNPNDHMDPESKQILREKGPSPKEEKPAKKFPKEPFDPTDPFIDLEKFYGFDYSKMPDGTPFDVYRQQQMDILTDAINNETDNFEKKLRISERRRIYQGYIAKPNLKSSTNLETIADQVNLLDDNTSRMNYSGAGKPYANLKSEYKQSTQYIDEFTDKYGRQYWAVTKVVAGIGMSNVKLYDKSKNSLQDLQDNSEDGIPASMLDVFNNKISMVHTSDRYSRRGLATAALYLARKRSGKEVQHSESLTAFGRAFSLSVDSNPVLHKNDESKALLLGNETGPSPKQEIPEDDGGDEIDTNRTPGNIIKAQYEALMDGLQEDFFENDNYDEISVDPENLPESLNIWKNLQFNSPISRDLKIAAAKLISAEMQSSAKNILRSLASSNSEELMFIGDEVRGLLEENEDESDDYDIIMRAFETDINNLNRDSLILSYDAEDVLMYVSTMGEFIDSEDEDKPDSYFTPERLLKQLNKYIKGNEMQLLSSSDPDITESMRYVGSVLFIRQWAKTSNDEELSDALQKAAVEVFDMKDGTWAARTGDIESESDERLKEVMKQSQAKYDEETQYLYDMNSQVYTDFIRSMYGVTQRYLKDLGIDYVRVYRGTGVTEARNIQGDSDFKSSGVGMIDVIQRPMSSWSFDEETALGFAANSGDNDFRDPMFIATLVPASQVLGFPGTGFGSFEEGELVLLGGSPRKVMAAVHQNNPQEKKSTGNWLSDAVVSNDPISERDFFLRKALPQIDEHFTNLSETDTQDLLNHNSGSTGPSPKEERVNSDENLVSLQQTYMEENDPELELDEDSETTFPRIGIGSDNKVIGYVKPQVLRSMKGNYTERNPNYRIDAKGGLYEPIRVSYDPENGLAVVIEGNHRVKAALDTKREYVPVFVVVQRGIPTDSSEWEKGFSPKKLENVDKSKIPDDFKDLATAHPIYIFDKSDVLTPPEQTTPLNIDDTSKNSDWIKNTGPSPKEETPAGGFPPEPFNPNDRTLDMDTIYNYDYTKLPDGTPFNAKQQKAMDHENKILEEAILSGDTIKISSAKSARRYTYTMFTTEPNPDSKTNTETIADQITLGKSKPKKFTGFVRYTDNFIDKYGRKYVIFTDISTDDSSDNAAIVTAHDLESQFLEPLFTPEGMENVDRFGGKHLHISSLKVNDSDRKDLNGSAEIGLVGTDDAYRRRGLATALLYLARKHYKKPVNHSSTLTRYGKAFSNSVDAGKPDLHDSLESKQVQIDLLKKKGFPVQKPELDDDEIDYGPSPKEETPPGQPMILTNKYLEVIPLNNAYRDKNDPDLDITEWVMGGTNIYGIGNGGNPLGYVRTEKLATMKGNLADMESSVSSISQDLEDGTGYLEPVLVRYNPLTGRSFIAEGNHRVEAARLIGREYVPVIVGVSTVDFKNPSRMEKEGGVGDTVLNKDGSLGNFRNVKDGSLINPYHLFNNEDLLYPRVNLDPNDVPGFIDVLKIQSELLDQRMAENQETGINDIAKWYDPNTFDVNSAIAYMGDTPEKLKAITAKNIGENMMSSAKDMLAAVGYGIWISSVLRTMFGGTIDLSNEEIAKKALDTKSDNLNGNSIVLFIDESEHSPYAGINVRTLGDVLDEMDPYDEELYGSDKYRADFKSLLEDFYANQDFKAIFFDKPKDVLAFKAKVASMLVAQWAETSNGNDMQSHALQMAAVDVFKMSDSSWAKWKFDDTRVGKDIEENAEYHYLTYGTVLKDFLKTMYDLTQDQFKNRGVKYLTLYRGTGVDAEAVKIDTGIEYNGVGDAEIIQRPMSAWTWLYGTAINFATSRLVQRAGMFMGTIVPVEQVLSIPGTGFGCFEEAEVVLLGGKKRLVRAVTSDSSDPVLGQKVFIDDNRDAVVSYLLDQLPKDKNAFEDLIEFNKSDFNSTGPSPKEETPLNVDNSIENSDWVISEFAKKKDATEPVDKQTILAAINDINAIADLGLPVDFTPPVIPSQPSQVGVPMEMRTKRGTILKRDTLSSGVKISGANFGTSTEVVAIQNSTEVAAKPTEKAIEVKNKIISLGSKILGPAKKAVDKKMIEEGLLPEGVDLDQHRLDLADDIAARTEIIKEKHSLLYQAIDDINTNAFKKLPYEVQEEVYQKLRENPGMYTIHDFFDANENLFMARTDSEGLESLSRQGIMSREGFGPIKLFSGRKMWHERKKAKGRGYEKVLVDLGDNVGSFSTKTGDDDVQTLENALLITALNMDLIDLSKVKKMSEELKSLRESATEVQNPNQFVKKYHTYLGEEVKKQLESLGMEFDSVDMSNVIGMVEPIYKATTDAYRYGRLTAKEYEQFMNRVSPSINSLDPKILEELQKTIDSLPKSFLMSMKKYYESISKKLGIRPSEARAHFFTATNGNGIVRGDAKDDFLHEFAHFFQGITPGLIAIENAFTYDRVRNEDGTLKPIMEVPYANDIKYHSDTFSGANIVEPYIVKQYRTHINKRLGNFNSATEVLTMGLQDLFGDRDAGRSVTPTGVTIITGKGSKRMYHSAPHMDIATGIWYTDKTMTEKINPKKITGISGLDKSGPTDWDFKALTIGLLLALADLEDN